MTTLDPETEIRRIEYRPLTEFRENPVNPKAHSEATICDSIRRFGFTEPVVVDERTGYLVSGHGRVASLRMMHADAEPRPAGLASDTSGGWMVPTVIGWASANDAEASAALIALNRSGEVGGWVDRSLLDILESLSEEGGAGLLGVGYDEGEIEDLRDRLADLDPYGTGDEPDSPEEFPEFDDSIPVAHQCPSCGYTWSGSTAPSDNG